MTSTEHRLSKQTRKVHVLGEDVTVRYLRRDEWVVHTAVGLVSFRCFRGAGMRNSRHWVPYFGDRELSQWTTTLLDTAVRRVMLRARVAFAVASALLHELAHAATIGDGHGEAWQSTYAAAIAEVTGIAVTPCADNYEIMNMACHDAMRAWWKSSGNAFAWSLLQKHKT